MGAKLTDMERLATDSRGLTDTSLRMLALAQRRNPVDTVCEQTTQQRLAIQPIGRKRYVSIIERVRSLERGLDIWPTQEKLEKSQMTQSFWSAAR